MVIFSCNHGPYVRAYEDRMIKVQSDYLTRGVELVAINSNDEKAFPEDNYQGMVQRAREKGFNFPYLRDPDQRVLTTYGGVCIPHVFAFD